MSGALDVLHPPDTAPPAGGQAGEHMSFWQDISHSNLNPFVICGLFDVLENVILERIRICLGPTVGWKRRHMNPALLLSSASAALRGVVL